MTVIGGDRGGDAYPSGGGGAGFASVVAYQGFTLYVVCWTNRDPILRLDLLTLEGQMQGKPFVA